MVDKCVIGRQIGYWETHLLLMDKSIIGGQSCYW